LISMDYLIAIGGKFALALAVMPHFNELFSFCFLLLFYFTMSKIPFSIVPPSLLADTRAIDSCLTRGRTALFELIINN